jgi:hypothetical protein
MSRRGRAFLFRLWPLLTVLSLVSSGCQPYYRDDELRAQRTEHSARRGELVAMGERLLAAGQPERAARSFAAALDRSAGREADLYLLLATAQQRGKDYARAGATARYGLTRPVVRADAHRQLRRLLVQIYAAAGFTRWALDFLEPATLAHAASLPELQPTLAQLAEAERLSEPDPRLALAKYAEWLSAYGEPDHPLLRRARNRILRAAAAETRDWAEQADQLLAQGQAAAAVRRYALVYRYHTDAAFAAERERFQRACAALPSPAAHSPLATSELRRATLAIEQGELAVALLHTRRAVTAAPCWSQAQQLLAELLQSLDGAGRKP